MRGLRHNRIRTVRIAAAAAAALFAVQGPVRVRAEEASDVPSAFDSESAFDESESAFDPSSSAFETRKSGVLYNDESEESQEETDSGTTAAAERSEEDEESSALLMIQSVRAPVSGDAGEGSMYMVLSSDNLASPCAFLVMNPESGCSNTLLLPAGCYYVQRTDEASEDPDRTLASMQADGGTIHMIHLTKGSRVRLLVDDPLYRDGRDAMAGFAMAGLDTGEDDDAASSDAVSTAADTTASTTQSDSFAGTSTYSSLGAQFLTGMLLGGDSTSALALLSGLILNQDQDEAGYSYDSYGQDNTQGTGYAASDWTPGPYVDRGGMSEEQFTNLYSKAREAIGTPYVWGGTSPESGFDCSGFVCWAINNSGNGWNVGRLTAEGLRERCQLIDEENAQPGDLIFFENTYSTPGASHVGIYLGSGKMIHAGNPVQITDIHTSYWESHGMQFGRLF